MEDNVKGTEELLCPDRNARCQKLSGDVLRKLNRGANSAHLDPRWGFVWSFAVGSPHYEHIADSARAAGHDVAVTVTPKTPGGDVEPSYDLVRNIPE